MQLTDYLVVPASTSIANLIPVKFEVPPGQLEHISITFPAGCSRMVNVISEIDGSPFFPAVLGTYYSEDNRTIEIDDIHIFDTLTDVYFYGWAPDTSYQHTISIVMTVLTAEEISMKRYGYY